MFVCVCVCYYWHRQRSPVDQRKDVSLLRAKQFVCTCVTTCSVFMTIFLAL